MWWQPPFKRTLKPWWDSDTARGYGFGQLAWSIMVKAMFPRLLPVAANDRDHCRW